MSRSRLARAWPWISWGLVAALLLPAILRPPPRETGAPHLRLLRPFLELASQVQWVRFQRARLHGEEVRALELADSALALDPSDTEGWETLASHLALFRASPEREPDLEQRRSWFRAGLEVLRRGSEHAAQPQALALYRGVLLVSKAEADPALYREGAGALYREAAEAFAQASALGAPGAAELERYARERAQAGR